MIEIPDSEEHDAQDRELSSHSIGSSEEGPTEWLDNPKRVKFIICAFIVFIVMTMVILFQLYSDSYRNWTSFHSHDSHNEGFIVSPTDVNRTFSLIKLDNGLQVLLISDKSTDTSAAAIDIGIGSSMDPLNYLGLAHFHEHMLFLGSKTYAKSDSFSSYISLNGGHDNAYTENMHTNFFFNVDNQHFEHSLDIFSHFFIDPLLSKKSMNDEIWAVDNEYRKDIPSQQWRDWRMFEYSAYESHPFHKFTVGSIQTLKAKGDVYDRMIAFHNKYVKANIMKCVIYGKEDIPTLTKWAKQKLSHIKYDKKPLIIAAKDNGTPYRKGIETGQIYYISTIEKQKQLTYLWAIAGMDLHRQYRTPVLSFLNEQLLESAHNQSLYNVLKIKLEFITGMNCDIFYSEDKWSGTAISFELTNKGVKNRDLITEYLYKYLNLILVTAVNSRKNLNRIYNLYFDESKCMDSLYFNYYALIKKEPYSIVSGLAKRMQNRDGKDLLYSAINVAPQRLIFNLSLIIKVVRFMREPANVIIHYTNDQFDTSNFDATEPYFKIKFHKQKIAESKLKQWSDIGAFKDAHTQSLQIPPLNPYILNDKHACDLNDFGLIKESKTKKNPKKKGKENIELLIGEASINIWYKSAHNFESPRININLLLISPLIYDRPINAIYAEIWLQFIDFYSSEWYAFVSAASYSFELSLNHQGIVLSITGLNKKHLTRLIEEFINSYMCDIHSLVRAHANRARVLRNILTQLQKTYKNLNYNHVWEQGYFAVYDIVKIPHYDRNLMLDIVNGLLVSDASRIIADVLDYVGDVLRNGFLIEGLFHGNIYRKSVVHLVSKIRLSGINIKTAKNDQKFVANLYKMDHLRLEMRLDSDDGDDIKYHKFIYQAFNSNEKDTNDVAQIWYQFGSNSFSERNYVETCQVLLLARMMKSECFQQLRTKESLGYVATTFSKSSVGATNNINYLVIMVVSGYKSANYLNNRIRHFVETHYYSQVLLKLTQQKFDSYINATINDLNKKYLRLSQETSLLWDEIIGHTYFWAWKRKYIEIFKGLTLKDMIAFYKLKILGKESKSLSVQLYKQPKPKQKKNKLLLLKKPTTDSKTVSHKIIATDKDERNVLYFNYTKDLQQLGYAKYFKVY